MNKKKPNINNIKIWGSVCYYKNKGLNISKLEAQGLKAVVIGYGLDNHHYKVLDFNKKRAF